MYVRLTQIYPLFSMKSLVTSPLDSIHCVCITLQSSFFLFAFFKCLYHVYDRHEIMKCWFDVLFRFYLPTGAVRKNMTPAHLKEDLVNLGEKLA